MFGRSSSGHAITYMSTPSNGITITKITHIALANAAEFAASEDVGDHPEQHDDPAIHRNQIIMVQNTPSSG